jgi:hypothetical protein
MEYDIEVRNHAGELSIGVEGDFDSDPAAINWAWYYLESTEAIRLSVSVSEGTTFSVQWGPPERLRRDPSDHGLQLRPEFEPACAPGLRPVRGAGVRRRAGRAWRNVPSSIQGISRSSRSHSSMAASKSPRPVAAAYRSR